MSNLKYSLSRRLVLKAVFILFFPVKLFSNNFLENKKKLRLYLVHALIRITIWTIGDI